MPGALLCGVIQPSGARTHHPAHLCSQVSSTVNYKGCVSSPHGNGGGLRAPGGSECAHITTRSKLGLLFPPDSGRWEGSSSVGWRSRQVYPQSVWSPALRTVLWPQSLGAQLGGVALLFSSCFMVTPLAFLPRC